MFLLVVVLSVHVPFGRCIVCPCFLWSLYCLFMFLLVVVLSVKWFTVLITPLISSNFSCWSLYCLSCDIPFWLPLWYLQTFLVGHCISCQLIYRSEYPFDIFKTFWISRFGLCVFKWRYFQQYCSYITVLLVEVTGVNLWLYHKRLQRVYHQMGGYRTHNFSVDWQWLHTYIFKIKLP